METQEYDIDSPQLIALSQLLLSAEVSTICDSLNETFLPMDVRPGETWGDVIRQVVKEALQAPRRLGTTWHCDDGLLMAKLSVLPEPLMIALGTAVEHFWDAYMDDDNDEPVCGILALCATGVVRCGAGHSLAPPRDDCAECLLVRLGAGT